MFGRRVNRWLLVWLMLGLSFGGSLFVNGSAEAHNSQDRALHQKSKPAHFLGRRAAKKYMRAVLIQRFSYDSRAGGSISCRKRLSRTRVACTMSWVIGDGGFFGRGTVWLTFRRHERQAHFSYRLTNVDEYCLDVTPEQDCTRKLRDKGLVPAYVLRTVAHPPATQDRGYLSLRASFHDCGDVPQINSYDIRAKRVRCGEARRVVRAYHAAVSEGGGFTEDVLGFHCKVVGLYGDGGIQRCAAKGHRVVRFLRGG